MAMSIYRPIILTNILLVASLLMSACGGGEFSGLSADANNAAEPSVDTPSTGSDGPTATPSPTTEPVSQMALTQFFVEEVWAPTLSPQCLSCHIEGGIAGTSGLVFSAIDQAALSGLSAEQQQATYFANVEQVINYFSRAEQNRQLFLSKPTGVAHGGGFFFAASDPSYAVFENLIVMVDAFLNDTGVVVIPDPEAPPVGEDNPAPTPPPPAEDNNPAPQASLVNTVIRTGFAPLTVALDATDSSDDIGVVRYQWTVAGEVLDIEEPAFNYEFAEAGQFSVVLTVFDGQGASSSTTAVISVLPGLGNDDNEENPILLFFRLSVWQPTLAPMCSNCHSPNGNAAATFLVFDPISAVNYANLNDEDRNAFLMENLRRINTYIQDPVNSELLLSKPTGVAHSGGRLFAANSTAYDNLASLIDQLELDNELFPAAVNAAPMTALVVTAATRSREVTLDASGSIDDGAIVSYLWEINGEVISTSEPQLTYQFSQLGLESVKVIAIDDQGEAASSELQIMIVD